MKTRLHFYLLAIVLIVGVILGSFFDLQLSQSIFSNRNGFGIAVTSFALLIGYGFISFTGGLLLRTTLNGNKAKWAKIILIVVNAISILVASYFSQKEMFSVNGLNKSGAGYVILAWAIALIVQSAIYYLAYRISINLKDDKLFIVVLIIWAAIILSLVAGVIVLKDIVHRPRYRTVQLNIEGLTYHNWWEPFKEYKSFITDTITKEEFKSFPSGHAGASCLAVIGAIFIPYIFPLKKRTQLIIYYSAVIYFLIVCFSRVLVGAHFLSDVSMGGLLTVVFGYIAFEITLKLKLISIRTIHN